MNYFEFLEILNEYAEPNFAEFQRKLIPTKQKILGIRTPIMRKIAKQFFKEYKTVFSYPDEVYEVTFIKLTMISNLPYEIFLTYIEACVSKIDNWATCDCFKAKCIKKNKKEYITVLEQLFNHGGEFFERYVLVILLNEYIEEEYFVLLEDYLKRANTAKYYIHMAAAWLTAEILVKHYEFGISLLKKGILRIQTHNKAIQKAIESYRLTKEQKDYLKSLKK